MSVDLDQLMNIYDALPQFTAALNDARKQLEGTTGINQLISLSSSELPQYYLRSIRIRQEQGHPPVVDKEIYDSLLLALWKIEGVATLTNQSDV